MTPRKAGPACCVVRNGDTCVEGNDGRLHQPFCNSRAPPPCGACLKADAMSTEFMPNRDRLRFRQVTIDTHHALLAAKDAELAERITQRDDFQAQYMNQLAENVTLEKEIVELRERFEALAKELDEDGFDGTRKWPDYGDERGTARSVGEGVARRIRDEYHPKGWA